MTYLLNQCIFLIEHYHMYSIVHFNTNKLSPILANYSRIFYEPTALPSLFPFNNAIIPNSTNSRFIIAFQSLEYFRRITYLKSFIDHNHLADRFSFQLVQLPDLVFSYIILNLSWQRPELNCTV